MKAASTTLWPPPRILLPSVISWTRGVSDELLRSRVARGCTSLVRLSAQRGMHLC
jgi:hypothetical protein